MAENIKKYLLEPLDDFLFGGIKILQKMGAYEPLRGLFYHSEGFTYNLLFKSLYEFEVFGGEYVKENQDSPIIYACNHQSILDPLVSGLAVYQSTNGKRHPFQLAKIELFTEPIMNVFVRLNRAIPIKRGDQDELAVERCNEVLNEGHHLVLYPEGTYNPGGGKFLKPHTGIARIAYNTHATVIPMAIYGTDRIFGKGAKIPKLKEKLKVKFGAPLTFQDLFKKSVRTTDYLDLNTRQKANKRATRKIFNQVKQLWYDLYSDFKEKTEMEGEA